MYNYKLERIYEHTEGYRDSLEVLITHEKQFTEKDIENIYNEFIQGCSQYDREVEYKRRYYNSVLDDFKRFLITKYGFKNIKYESVFVKDDFYY